MSNLPDLISVSLGVRSYPIYIGSGILSDLGDHLLRHQITSELLMITDSTVASFYLPAFRKALQRQGLKCAVIVLPPGEYQKSMKHLNNLYTEMLSHQLSRKGMIIAFGGGVVGDFAGYAAATYMRGIPFIHVPTTLLAQVDSSIGGKVGINHPLGKNIIGSFHQPTFVLSDTSLLRTLPRRERICGLGEIVKYGLILDAKLFSTIEDRLESIMNVEGQACLEIVHGCASLKAQVVERDEYEQGERAILNAGHTIGHALEQAGNYRVFKHGEAILLGLLVETSISTSLGHLPPAECDRVEDLIMRIPLPRRQAVEHLGADLFPAIAKDKKNVSGQMRIPLIATIGKCELPIPVDRQTILRSLKSVKRRLVDHP